MIESAKLEESMRPQTIVPLLLVAVLVIGGGWFAYKRHSAVSQFDQGRYQAGGLGAKSLQMKVQMYELDVGNEPASLNDLLEKPSSALGWKGPYAKDRDLIDPFGHSYLFRVPGEHGKTDVVFLGKDGRVGGSGIDADLGDWEIKP
jgi:general secretion pathway protein G